MHGIQAPQSRIHCTLSQKSVEMLTTAESTKKITYVIIILNHLYLLIERQSAKSNSIKMQYYVSDRCIHVSSLLNIVQLTCSHHI